MVLGKAMMFVDNLRIFIDSPRMCLEHPTITIRKCTAPTMCTVWHQNPKFRSNLSDSGVERWQYGKFNMCRPNYQMDCSDLVFSYPSGFVRIQWSEPIQLDLEKLLSLSGSKGNLAFRWVKRQFICFRLFFRRVCSTRCFDEFLLTRCSIKCSMW